MQYPGGHARETGETVTYTYTPQMALKSVFGNGDPTDATDDTYYAQFLAYDAAGRLKRLNTAALFSDEFPDSTLNANWSWYKPLTGPSYSLTVRPGWLRLSVPADKAYNHWATTNNAPQMQTAAPSGDWIMETKVNLSSQTGSGFHGGLMVRFSATDIAYWGFMQGKNLALKRSTSGTATLLSATNTASTVWLRVRKQATTYWFEYKVNDADNWTTVGSRTWTTVPQQVGLILRTWSVAAINLDFDRFNLIKDPRLDLQYTYDMAGNISAIQNNLATGESTGYEYDALDRLETVSGAQNESYAYDGASGVLSTKTVGSAPALSYSYGVQSSTTCQGGGIRSIAHAVSSFNGVSYGYDCNGNMTTRGGLTLSYDAENRLTGVSGTTTANFTYDGDGRRVKGVEGGVTTVYIGNYYEWSAGDSTSYYYAGGQRLAMRRAGYSANNGLFWLLSDHLGSTRAVLDGSSGAATQSVTYNAWGGIKSGTLNLTSFTYTGQRRQQIGQPGLPHPVA